VGEVKAVAGFVRALKAGWPELFVCMSCMTATGRKVAGDIPEIDLVFPLPFDLPWVMKRHLLRILPKAILVVETEIWPHMILEARRLAVPVVFVNARMSKRAHGRYMRFSSALRPILDGVKVLAMAADDAERFRSIGARDVQVLGNLKLDNITAGDRTRSNALRDDLGIGDRPVFVAGSIREGEERLVVDAVLRASVAIPDLYTVIAPRHPDRIRVLTDMAQGLGIRWSLRSTGGRGADLLIVDTMGELFALYGMSDAAFVGGSLLDLGGQNILEPIAWGVPTIHGPYMDNFTWALDVVKGFTYEVKDPRDLAETLVSIIKDRGLSCEKGQKALEALTGVRGVTERYVEAIEELL
jgi:3-deoxy-D-manno-octulosonic-acid transferase